MAELLALAHEALRLAVALGMRHAEVAAHALLGRSAAFDGDDRHRAVIFPADTGNHGGIVAKVPIAVELYESVQAQLDHLARRGAVGRARELDDLKSGLRLVAALYGPSTLLAALARMHELVGSPRGGRMPLMQGQKLADRKRDFAARHDRVTKAMFQQELGALEPLRQALVHVLLDHAGAGERRQRIRLG